MKALRMLIVSVLIVSIASCNLPLETVPSVEPTIEPASPVPKQPKPATSVPSPAEHRIAVRVVNGVGEFYHRLTGEKFVPRGMNYIRLGPQTKMDGSPTFGHSFFAPGQYDSLRISGDLSKMHADGYNVVRVFLSPDTM